MLAKNKELFLRNTYYFNFLYNFDSFNQKHVMFVQKNYAPFPDKLFYYSLIKTCERLNNI